MLTAREFEHVVAAFERTGFSGANAWYLNDALNEAYAAEAKSFGVLATPALFLHAASDSTCDTIRTRLAEPMRRDCLDLSEVTIDAGHELMRERPNETNRAIEAWLSERGTMPYGC
jgi:pimeloyl-ACP methyl ester carboxylesterase